LTEGRRIVREVATAVGLAEGERGVRTVLAALARLEPVSTRRISRAAELPVPIVAAVCGELRKRSGVAHERPTQLTATGRELFAGGSLKIGRPSCAGCGGRGIVVPGELSPLVRVLSKAVRGGPRARLELDQCHCTVDTKLRRLLAVHEAGALVGRRILLLGDDDLTALALHLLVQHHGSGSTIASLAIVDVDPALISFLAQELAEAPFPVTCTEHDLRRQLPPVLVGAFDTVVTDPPYTTPAARLFLSRAADALDGGRGDVFLSYGSRRPGAAAQLQRVIVETGFVIQRLSRDFNEYVGAGVLGGTSHLYHLAAGGDLTPAVTGDFFAPLYTADDDGIESRNTVVEANVSPGCSTVDGKLG
jgi:N4-bis(aminopropyl)spermidine synthase